MPDRLGAAFITLATAVVTGCGGGSRAAGSAAAGSPSESTMGDGTGSMASGQTASPAGGAASGLTGSSGSLVSGATTAGASGAAIGSPASSGSSSGTAGVSGADGGALATGGSGMDTSTPGLTDPGNEGDGDRTIGPTYMNAPDTLTQPGVPKGAIISFMLPPGTIYPKAPTRDVRVYVPAQYVAGL